MSKFMANKLPSYGYFCASAFVVLSLKWLLDQTMRRSLADVLRLAAITTQGDGCEALLIGIRYAIVAINVNTC